MDEMFLAVLKMSLRASYVILFVILVRLALKKAPKIISYLLWTVVAFRLIVPFSFESMFSFMPRDISRVAISYDKVNHDTTLFDTIDQQSMRIEMKGSYSYVNNTLPAPVISSNPFQEFLKIGGYLWIIGIIALLLYSYLSIRILKRQLKSAQLIEGNIYEASNLKTPFVLGVIRPKIYLPYGLDIGERSYILLHEQTHIKRKDHMVKLFSFLILSLHWFNPLVWVAFVLMNKDMELSCDERVLKETNSDIKKSYAHSLLSLATGNHIVHGNPLAFSEGNVKSRIKNVLNYKKPKFWVFTIAVITLIVVGIGLLSNPIAKSETIFDVSIKDQGTYATIFLNPISSMTARGFSDARQDNEYYFTENRFEIVSNLEKDRILVKNPIYKEEKLGDKINVLGDMVFDISNYTSKKSFHVYTSDDKDTGYIIYITDDEIWISHWRWLDKNKDNWCSEYILKIGSTSIDSKNDSEKDNEVENVNWLQFQNDFDVEKSLEIIMSSPKQSSNPYDYIENHKNEYEKFFKYGGEDALQYMLSQFEQGKAEGLRGQIMMILCKELLGARNNVTDKSLSPEEWYKGLEIRQEIILPNYEYDGQDMIEKLVYETEIEMASTSNDGGFIVVAPKIFGSYEEEDKLKVFVTTYSARYKLYGNTLSNEGGSIIPAAITYRKDNNGAYVLESYEQAKDGSEFLPSIKEYSKMPVSGKKIKGLADEIIKHYSNYDDICALLDYNLYHHLKKHGITDATLTNSIGEVLFHMSDPKFKN